MKKQIGIQFILTLAMLMMATACGKESNVNEQTVTETTMIFEEEIVTEETESTEEWRDNLEEETNMLMESEVNTQSDKNNMENSMDIQGNEHVSELAEQSFKEQQENEQLSQQPTEKPVELIEEQPQKEVEQAEQQAQEPIEQPIPTATLNGRIISVSTGEFVIRKATVIDDSVMVSSENDEKVSVVYTDKTKFVLCTTSDGGITANYTDVSSSSLSSDKLVEIQGVYEGNSFMAQKVTIYSFN